MEERKNIEQKTNIEKRNRRIDWTSLIVGIGFIFVSFIAFKNPYASLASLVVYFGMAAIVKGIGGIVIYNKIKGLTRLNVKRFMWIGIVDIVMGIIIMLNIESAMATIPYMFAIWFIVDSVNDLTYGKYLRFINAGLYWLHVIVNVITLMIGISMMYNPLSASFTVVFLIGMYLAIAGIKYIVHAFEHEY